MAAEPSKYAENQFLSTTARSFSLMSEFVADTIARAFVAADGDPAFTAVLANLDDAAANWTEGEIIIINAEAAQLGATMAFAAKMDSLTRKPDPDTNSPLQIWDNIIRNEVAYQGPIYTTLLPNGRETLTTGTLSEQLVALAAFASRLSAVVAKPALVALGATVLVFSNDASAMRTTQLNAMATVEAARQAQEPLRVAAAVAIFSLAGQGMVTWGATPDRVDSLFDINILRNPPQQIPEAPADTTWTAATRALATTALPAGATRLEAWRTGPGSMPEFLHTAGRGETQVIIPATITFTPGGLYQLWLVAINSKGKSPAGPVQNWTAV